MPVPLGFPEKLTEKYFNEFLLPPNSVSALKWVLHGPQSYMSQLHYQGTRITGI